jgi:hypothetical protein
VTGLIKTDHGKTQLTQLRHPWQKAQAEAGPAMHHQRIRLRGGIAPHIGGDGFAANLQLAALHVGIGLRGARTAAAAGERRGEQPRGAFHRADWRKPAAQGETDAHGAEFPCMFRRVAT